MLKRDSDSYLIIAILELKFLVEDYGTVCEGVTPPCYTDSV